MIILGIETSCDDTSCAVVAVNKDTIVVLSNVVSSQIKIHKKYNGIVPELAARSHLENINFVIDEALCKANCKIGDIDAVAVTAGPGLIGSLLIGTTTAQAISHILKIPIVGVNHIEGHIFANLLKPQITPTPLDKNLSNWAGVKERGYTNKIKPPFIALIVSGGHTDLILVKDWGNYKILGRTRDDAVGEVFDKIAKFLKLGYPGGPIIDKFASRSSTKKGGPQKINFPRPYMLGSWDFSFSGLKTAVVNYAHDSRFAIRGSRLSDLCASFQQSCVDVLIRKAVLACEKFN
ncbi:MAG: tRNA (adenosine(37)-N6)-threonylcarbamoyltransferase complex transferase subunit TsaD, partial [Elusimicrobiota bacterium]